MKRMIALCLCGWLMVSLAACGAPSTDGEATQPTAQVNGPKTVDEAITLSMNAQFLRDKSAYQTAIPDDAKVYIETANDFTFVEAVEHICKGVDMGAHMTLDWRVVQTAPCTEADMSELKTKLEAYGMKPEKLGKAEQYALLLTSSLDGIEETMDLNTIVFEYEGRWFAMYLIEDLMGRVPFMNIAARSET